MGAPNIIKIDGRTFNKCHVSKEQWNAHATPCVYCHSKIQMVCARNGADFCYGEGERVCYIDLGAIYGED